eukprot:CAMPEP_0183412114 /NCGR_PEP_ID=MMETSP0370-20130417/20787_1 /TAXON_ID=268820 /ORGANISM="Peridinium aciculiferum, Strain PAER-2" /LENGTH=79 /DNA_ID=CAMNT_0025595179 /DNA_START=233 /DNA_END=472 /DNA_ORIENTATION=-
MVQHDVPWPQLLRQALGSVAREHGEEPECQGRAAANNEQRIREEPMGIDGFLVREPARQGIASHAQLAAEHQKHGHLEH